jgi:hypothetical protein
MPPIEAPSLWSSPTTLSAVEGEHTATAATPDEIAE